jgi:hypothetical protein
METPDHIMLRVRELRREMQRKNNVRRVIYLASSLYDTVLQLENRIEVGKARVKFTPWHKPFLENLTHATYEAEKVLQEVANQPDLMVLAAKAIFDAEEVMDDTRYG